MSVCGLVNVYTSHSISETENVRRDLRTHELGLIFCLITQWQARGCPVCLHTIGLLASARRAQWDSIRSLESRTECDSSYQSYWTYVPKWWAAFKGSFKTNSSLKKSICFCQSCDIICGEHQHHRVLDYSNESWEQQRVWFLILPICLNAQSLNLNVWFVTGLLHWK